MRNDVLTIRGLPGCLFAVVLTVAALSACDSRDRAPPGFSPTRETLREAGHIARCNTVHSLTLPVSVMHRYGIEPDRNKAVLSCSLQVVTDGAPANVAAQVEGTATVLTGRTTAIEFQEILETGAISYLGAFTLAGKSRIAFNVRMTDLRTGQMFTLDFEQADLPGRL